jgi:hypothetical protein
MGALAEKYRPGDVERSARDVWAARGFPPADGVVGRSSAPIVRQFEGSLLAGDDPGLVAFRAVAADVDARYLALAGRRAVGILRYVAGGQDDPALVLLKDLSIWIGGVGGLPVDTGDRRAGVATILGRMASRGLIATRDTSLRICPSCGQARSPERIIYQQEEGDTYLVRFPLPYGDGVVNAIVWVDAPWRLLGASALLVSPHLPYVVARYRRRGVDEKILTSRPSLARLLEWLPGGEVEVIEEAPGSHFQGLTYQYPLRHEFPMGGDLTAPSGTVLAVPDVGDSGTGIVPLVPGHGGTDALIADRLGIFGWPLVTARGQLDFNIAHKYSGLDIPTASEFVARDLGENGALFARLRVRRGVPHCAICGTAMVWAPGRAWCLEPSRLPAERRDLYRRLLPKDPPVGQVEVAAWPVSESATASPGPFTVTLLECPGCERLEPVGASVQCTCGGHRNPVPRRLLPSIAGTLSAWARSDPFPAGDSAWLYLNERRRTPALVHHLAVMAGVPGAPNDLGLTVLPGIPEGGVAALVKSLGADAVRAALVVGERRERSGPTYPERCQQEARRMERWWFLARDTLDRCDSSLLAAFAQPIAGSLGELESEDRAILARWERVRLAALADFDHQAAGAAYRRVATFLSNDLESYMARVRSRVDRSGTPPSRRAALRTLHHLLRESAVMLAPVAPHIAETVWGALVPGRTSVFESNVDPLDSALLDESAIKAWDRWGSVGRALQAFRRGTGLDSTAPLPAVVALVGNDDLAAQLRADRSTLQRLGHVERFEAFGPSTPWTGRERSFEPIPSEIQRAYPQEAGQIIHLLKRMPPRKKTDGVASEELSVVVRGLPHKILPSMVEYTERLPDRFVAVPWSLGELYIELPAHRPLPTRSPPPCSPDAFRLLWRVEHELRHPAASTPVDHGPVLIATLDPLAAELRSVARPLAAYLGVSEVRIVDPSAEFPRAQCLFGRTRTGVHWWVRLPGEPIAAARAKRHVARARLARVRSNRSPALPAREEEDFASEAAVAHGEEVRALVQELDGILGAPLLGPTAVDLAWIAGFHSLEAFGHARFDQITALPGFGRPVAEALVRKLGGVVPARTARPRTTPPSERSSAPAVRAVPTMLPPTTPGPRFRAESLAAGPSPSSPPPPASTATPPGRRFLAPPESRSEAVLPPPTVGFLPSGTSTLPENPPNTPGSTSHSPEQPQPPPSVEAGKDHLPEVTPALAIASPEPAGPSEAPQLRETTGSSDVVQSEPRAETGSVDGLTPPARQDDPSIQPVPDPSQMDSSGRDAVTSQVSPEAIGPSENLTPLHDSIEAIPLGEIPRTPEAPEEVPTPKVSLGSEPDSPSESASPAPSGIDPENLTAGDGEPPASSFEAPRPSVTPDELTDGPLTEGTPELSAPSIEPREVSPSEPGPAPEPSEILPPWAAPPVPSEFSPGGETVEPPNPPSDPNAPPGVPIDSTAGGPLVPGPVPRFEEVPSSIPEPERADAPPVDPPPPDPVSPEGGNGEGSRAESVDPRTPESPPTGSVDASPAAPVDPSAPDPVGPPASTRDLEPPSLVAEELDPSPARSETPPLAPIESVPPPEEPPASPPAVTPDPTPQPVDSTVALPALVGLVESPTLVPSEEVGSASPETTAGGESPPEVLPSTVPAPLPVAPELLVEPIPPPTPSGGITLTVAPSYLPAFAHFLDATAAGHRGICVVRESPDRLRTHVGPRPVEIYWLSNLGRGLTLRPADLEGYGAFLARSVEQDRVTAVFLEGVEYLARVHGAERVIEQLAAFHVVAQARNARAWVYLHPDLIPPADLALFQAAFGNATSSE